MGSGELCGEASKLAGLRSSPSSLSVTSVLCFHGRVTLTFTSRPVCLLRSSSAKLGGASALLACWAQGPPVQDRPTVQGPGQQAGSPGPTHQLCLHLWQQPQALRGLPLAV